MTRNTRSLLLALALGAASLCALAGDTIKVGVIAEMSGTFADFGRHMVNGAQAYMKQHGDTVAGKKVELIVTEAKITWWPAMATRWSSTTAR